MMGPERLPHERTGRLVPERLLTSPRSVPLTPAERRAGIGRVGDRAEELAKAHHAEMGVAMRRAGLLPANAVVGPWDEMPVERRVALVAVFRSLLDKGVVT